MKTYITYLILLLSFQSLSQEIISSSTVLGSWKRTGYEMNQVFYADTEYQEIISFFVDGSCEWFNAQQDSVVFKGNWSFNLSDRNTPLLEIQDCFKIPREKNWYIGDRSNTILQLTNDELILSGYEGDQPLKIIYVRTTSTKQKYPLEERVQNLTHATNQSSEYIENIDVYLVNNQKPQKVKKINGYYSLDVHLDCSDSLERYTSYSHTLSGTITKLTDSTVQISIDAEDRYWEIDDKEYGSSYRDNVGGYDGEVLQAYELSNISSIDYKSPVRHGFTVAGGWSLTLGGLSALIVAPLVSINFKTGDFNSKRYFTVAGVGMGAVGLSIPLFSIGKSKNFSISKKKSKHHWSLQQAKL